MKETEVFSLKNISRSFATRAKGQEVTQCVGAIMEAIHPKILLVDFNGVRAASPSFIDEFINGIQAIHAGSCRSRIVFTGDDSDIINLVDVILRRRAFPIRYAVQPDNLDRSPVRMLGNPSS
jgi:hypothetical protein